MARDTKRDSQFVEGVAVSESQRVKVLFTGYAPVHFACFRPLFDQLSAMDGFDVHLSGGLRTKVEDGIEYDLEGMYSPFGVAQDRLLSVEQIKEMDFDVLFASNTKMIMPRSVRERVQIFHGISFRNKSVRSANANADFYFIVGPYMKRAFVDSGIMTDGDPRALEMGFLKTDGLLNGNLDRAKTLAAHGFTGERPVLLYAPTGQKNNSLETMGKKVIKRLIKSKRYDLIVKPHDHPKKKIDWREELAPLEGDHMRVSREPDVITLLHAADLLITDASSVSSEYSLLDRPMVFLDVPKLLAKAGKGDESKLDLDTWGRKGGPIVEEPDEVVSVVDGELADPDAHAQVRQAMAQDLFFNPGQATQAATQWLAARYAESYQPSA